MNKNRLKWRRQAQPETVEAPAVIAPAVDLAPLGWHDLQRLGSDCGVQVVGVSRDQLEAAIREAMA